MQVLEELGLIPPRDHSVLDARQLVAPTLEQAKVLAETKPTAEPAPEPAPSPSLAIDAHASNASQHTLPLPLPLTGLRLPLRSPMQTEQTEVDSPSKAAPHGSHLVQRGPRPQTPRRTSSNQKGKEGKGGKARVDAFGPGPTVAAELNGRDTEAAGKRFVEVCVDAESRESQGGQGSQSGQGKASKGSAKGPGPPGKGKGGKGPKGPPMPNGAGAPGDAEGKEGKGKGKKGPALPGGKGGRIRKVTPLGRRFHWKELPADKVKGTVFDDINSSNSLEVQFEGLKNYFADDDELSKAPGASSTKDDLPHFGIFCALYTRVGLARCLGFRVNKLGG